MTNQEPTSLNVWQCWLVAGWLLTRDTWVAAYVGPLATAQPGAATNGGHQPRLSPGHQRVSRDGWSQDTCHVPRAAQYSGVCRYEAEEVAACLGVDLVTTSAKEDVNIEHVFRTIANITNMR